MSGFGGLVCAHRLLLMLMPPVETIGQRLALGAERLVYSHAAPAQSRYAGPTFRCVKIDASHALMIIESTYPACLGDATIIIIIIMRLTLWWSHTLVSVRSIVCVCLQPFQQQPACATCPRCEHGLCRSASVLPNPTTGAPGSATGSGTGSRVVRSLSRVVALRSVAIPIATR